MACTHEALSPYTFERSEQAPTNTYTTAKQFAQRLRGVLSRINARIRTAIDEKDLFGLRSEALVDDVPEDVFNFPTDSAKVTGFLQWLRTQLDEHFLTVVGPDQNQFIRSAYLTGIRNAQDQLSELDIAFTREGAESIVTRPIHRSSLQELYTRTYDSLQSVRDDVAQEVRDELVTGFRDGKGPRDIARSLTDRVNSIGKNRATMIARSEIINSHSTGTLTTAEEINRDAEQEISTSHGVWDSAMDERMCALCGALNGTEFRIEEMRNNNISVSGNLPESFIGRNFRLKPPAHPNCRCGIRIMVGGSIDTPLNDRLPEGIQA